MEMTIHPMNPEERLYCHTQSHQIMAQTGCIGHLRADYGANGKGFYTDWDDHVSGLKTEEFKAEFDEIINDLRFDTAYDGMLKNRSSMARFCRQRPEGRFDAERYDYGYRVDTEKYTYLFRLNPNPGEYNVYCYCYVRQWLDSHMKNAARGIRFITPDYKEIFRIADGGMICIHQKGGQCSYKVCRYIDDTHVEVGRSLYHICEFAELVEAAGITVAPLKQGEEVRISA